MFVKKDLRKIPQILTDAANRAPPSIPQSASQSDSRPPTPSKGTVDKSKDLTTDLSFARRAPEFLPFGNISVLLEPKFRPALNQLVRLSLYDCGLKTLAGIGCDEEFTHASPTNSSPMFPNLKQMDLGRNPQLTSLPSTFHIHFPTLFEFWCDDCSFGHRIPETLLQLQKLRVVRMTGNNLEGALNEDIGTKWWKELRILALDRNKIERVGRGLGELKFLEKLNLRQNKLSFLPNGVPGINNRSLSIITLSSNHLTSIPFTIADVGPSLKEVYLNANRIEELPKGLGNKLTGLKKLNLAHNKLGGKGSNCNYGGELLPPEKSYDGDDVLFHVNRNNDSEPSGAIALGKIILPRDFIQRFGIPDAVTGNCTKDENCLVMMKGNPFTEEEKKWLQKNESIIMTDGGGGSRVEQMIED